MATYFHGSSEIQAAAAPSDGIQTLYLMNPNCLSSYTDASSQQHHPHQPPNMLFFNPANGLNQATLAHAPPQSHHLVGIPIPSPASADPDNHGRSSSLHGVVPAGIHYNLWGSMDQSQQVASVAATTDSGGPQDVISSQMEFRRPLVMSPVRQGLSLSLSSQQAQRAPQAAYRSITNEHEVQAMHGSGHVSPISPGTDIRVSGNSPSSVSAVSNGVLGFQSVVLGSKYLRAAQELLDEAVNVRKGMKGDSKEGPKEKKKMSKESATVDGSSSAAGGESSAKPGGAELTTAQRQELQMRKAKLVNMLDEVEQRYGHYHRQMQVVVSSFEQAAGFGAAKSYTALALQTISKQFRCLKDAISAQIKATAKTLGEEDCLGVKAEGSRLRYVDHQLRQQRALQHLGMIQHNAWRPQRGLPERAVSILRAWLFEHFLHPYPKDLDKQMLAKQTGLTRSQVSNWFINARVRLWKPMVEEMYLEEVKEHEKNNDSAENSNKNENKEAGINSSTAAGESSSTLQMDQVQLRALHSKPEKSSNQNASPTEFSNSTISMSPVGGSVLQPQAGFTLIRPSHQMERVSQRSPSKKPKGGGDMQNSPSSILSMEMDMKQGEVNREITVSFGGERLTKDGYPMITSTASNGGGFGAYPMADLGRFNPDHLAPPRFAGNGVSLTLGLPHADNHLSLSGPHHQQNFLSNQSIHLGRRLEIGIGDDHQPDFSSNGFENLGDIQNRKGFAAQLLPDFVA